MTKEASPRPESHELVNILHTKGWRVDALFTDTPINEIAFQMVDVPSVEPQEARELRIQIWTDKLLERKKVMEKATPGIELEILDDVKGEDATRMPALFEGTKKKMWAGPTVTPVPGGIIQQGGKTVINLAASNYSEQVACLDPRYREIFEKSGIDLPNIGFAASVVMITSDGHIVLTRRGIETPIYPAQLYMPGGGPKPGQTSVEAMLEEIAEEVGLRPDEDFDTAQLQAVALVTDTNFVDSGFPHPELIGALKVNRTLGELARLQHDRAASKGRLQDVWTLESVYNFPPTLNNYIKFNGPQMCPPTEAALVLASVLHEEVAPERRTQHATALIRMINSFERTKFEPPIKRMG